MHRGTRERSTTPCRCAHSAALSSAHTATCWAHRASSIRSQPLRVLLPGWLLALPALMPPSHHTHHRFQGVVCADCRACWCLAGCCRQHRHLQQLWRYWLPAWVQRPGCCRPGAAVAMPAALGTSRQMPHVTPLPAATDTDPRRESRHEKDFSCAYCSSAPPVAPPQQAGTQAIHAPTAWPAPCKQDRQLLCLADMASC